MLTRAARRLLLAVILVLVSAPLASAQKPAPRIEPVTPPLHRLYLEGARPLGALCQIGETDTSLDAVNYVEPPNDAFYTLLRSTQCPACVAPDTLLIDFAHVVLDYPALCEVQARVAIVGAVGGPGCWTPDTNVVLCARRSVSLQSNASGMFDLAVPLASGCRIARDAFLEVTFMSFHVSCVPPQFRPRLVLSSACASCESYEHYDTINGRTQKDLCADLGFQGKPTMYVDGEVCTTPALPTSWGSLKIRYR